MPKSAAWDWTPGKREIYSLAEDSREYGWIEEFHASPDGERVAAVVNMDEGEFTVVVNGEPWSEDVFERIWNLQFSPDGKLTGFASDMGEWKFLQNGEASSDDSYGYLMNTLFSRTGDSVACAVQQDMQYGMMLNGKLWENMYENANQFAISDCGSSTAAVVQIASMKAADIEAFQKGCFSVAVNGTAWDGAFVNCWSPVFDRNGKRVAAQVRTSLYDYTIAVDGVAWKSSYKCVWNPSFNPATGAVVAPVRIDGKWGMAQDEKLVWPAEYTQVWHQQFSDDGKNLYAIVAPSFGKWTVARNGERWNTLITTMVCDLVVSPDGERAAAVTKEGDMWSVMADDKLWGGGFAMVWKPVFSSDSKHVAARVELAGKKYSFVVDGKQCAWEFDQLWNPIFSPDGSAIMIRGMKDGVYSRSIVPVTDIHKGG